MDKYTDKQLKGFMILGADAYTEKHVKMAAKLYEMRGRAKRWHKERYETEMAGWIRIIQECMAKHSISELEAVLKLCKDANDSEDANELSIMNIMSAGVEMIEPSQP